MPLRSKVICSTGRCRRYQQSSVRSDTEAEAKTVADAVLYTLSGFGLVHIADKIEDPLVPTMGNLAVMGRHLIRRGTEALKEGFETMKEKLMNPQYDRNY